MIALTTPERVGIFVGVGGAALGIVNFVFNAFVWRRSIRTKVKVIVERGTTGPVTQRRPVLHIEAVNMSHHDIRVKSMYLIWNGQGAVLPDNLWKDSARVSPHDVCLLILQKHLLATQKANTSGSTPLTFPAKVRVKVATFDRRRPFHSRVLKLTDLD